MIQHAGFTELEVLTSPVLQASNADSVAIEVLPGAVAFRDTMLAKTRAIESVSTQEGFATVVEAVKELRLLAKTAEECRVQVKAPIRALGSLIDEKAKEYASPITVEAGRLQKLADVYDAEQQRLKREAERLRAEEIRKAQEAERLAREAAEAERRKAEQAAADAKAAEDVDPFAAAEAEAEANRQKAEAQQKLDAAQQTAAEAIRTVTVATSTAIAPPKTAGTKRRLEPKFAIHDLLAFANARPDLVTITAKTAEILAEMRKITPWEGRKPIVQAVCSGMVDGVSQFVAEGWWEERLVIG